MWSFKEMKVLSKMSFQVNAFSVNENDEFVVVRENGEKQGVFKTWAVPVIPFLDSGNIEILNSLWIQSAPLAKETGFESVLNKLSRSRSTYTRELAREALGTINSWTELCRKRPSYLERSLERARVYSWILDKRLAHIFITEPLFDEPKARIGQLVNRLHLAFGLMSPFYNLEALAALPESHYLNPGVRRERKRKSATGKLDVVSFLLPPAFREHIFTETLDWKNLNWEVLRNQTQEILHDKRKKKALLGISRLAAIPIHHVVFAANVLEWIPRRVGGKKNDPISTEKALVQLEEILRKDESKKDGIAVLSQMNALIRFLNWVPLIESEENFRGRLWTYSSVCDTTEDLLGILEQHPEVWEDGFAEVFESKLSPQVANLDASSAKGRFLLHLILKENKLKEEVQLDQKWQEQILQLVEKPNHLEFTDPLRTFYPISLAGGKPVGLALAGVALEERFIPKGFVISTSAVELFLKENEELWEMIVRLNKEEILNQKLSLAKKIEQTILIMPLPYWLDKLILQGLESFPDVNLWAVRGSSLDEGIARGLHKTLLRIPRRRCPIAVKKCVASYYSRRAVLFRKINSTGDLPCFAVFLIPYLRGKGGVASRRRVNRAWKENLSIGTTPAMVTAGRPGVREIAPKDGEMEANEAEVIKLLRDLSEIFGQVQIEWIVKESEIQILQMEILPIKLQKEKGKRMKQDSPIVTVEISSYQDFTHLEEVLEHREEKVSVRVGGAINLDKFQGELLAMIAQYGKKINKIYLDREISPSSHFANICRYFGVILERR